MLLVVLGSGCTVAFSRWLHLIFFTHSLLLSCAKRCSQISNVYYLQSHMILTYILHIYALHSLYSITFYFASQYPYILCANWDYCMLSNRVNHPKMWACDRLLKSRWIVDESKSSDQTLNLARFNENTWDLMKTQKKNAPNERKNVVFCGTSQYSTHQFEAFRVIANAA